MSITIQGIVENGRITPSSPLPEGARVEIRVCEEREVLDYPHPMAPYDREKELALLRERVAESKRGVPDVPIRDAMTRIANELNLTQGDAG